MILYCEHFYNQYAFQIKKTIEPKKFKETTVHQILAYSTLSNTHFNRIRLAFIILLKKESNMKF